MRKILLGLAAIIGVIAVLGATAPANATVNVDSNGYGFVGKGDVQTALGGLNNEALQTRAGINGDGVKFTYVTTDTYEVVNAWATGNASNPVSLNSHEVTVTTTVGVNAAVNYDARKVKGQKQWTGFNLTGFGASSTIGTIPVESATVEYTTFSWTDKKGVEHTTDRLPVDENNNLYTEGNNKAVLSVTLLSSTGGLFVDGQPLPNTLVV